MAALHSRHPYHTDRSHADSAPTHSRSWYTPRRMATYHGDKNGHHMADTYSWVFENDYKGNGKTEQWILQQRMLVETENPSRRAAARGSSVQKIWEETVHYKITAEQRMRLEEAQRRATEREKRGRLVDEEIRRIETRLRIKREEERRKIAEERRKTQEAQKERDRRNRLKAEKTVLEAWRGYEEKWQKLLCSSSGLTFASIPWPVVATPGTAEDIKPQAVVSFLFSRVHSEKTTQKERLRRAQLRWHPDRFQRVLVRVEDSDKEKVEEAVGIVARCLNDIKL